MLSENIILQSAGSLSVAVLALLMLILQALFFFRKPQFTWYAWSSAISFSALLYSVAIFLEYNTPEGPLNRFSGLLEYTAVICLIHSLYGFTFSYLGIESKRYHPVAGVCHGLILILLWFTNYIVAESFTTRNFIGLEFPYIEPALGPLGPVFVLYSAIAGVYAMIIWIKHKRTDPKHRITYLAGMGFWLLLGIHDGLASLGVPTFQYVMEYGFLVFAMVVLWVVFNNYLEIAAEEKYRVITEFANDCILVIQDGKMVFGNPACCDLIGGPLTDSEPRDFLDIMASEDRKTVLEHYNTLLEGGRVPNTHTARIRRTDGEQRFVEIASSVIRYGNRPAVLAVMRDITDRKKAEKTLRESEEKFRAIFEQAAVGVALTSTRTGELIQINQKYRDIVGYSEDELKSLTFQEITHPDDLQAGLDKMQELIDGKIHDFSMEKRYLGPDGSTVWVNLTVSPMWKIEDQPTLHIAVIEDITERKLMEAEVKTLSGLLPICVSCKKIRDDKGYWNQIESYIHKHSEAQFSHGICPECMDKIYGEEDWYKEHNNK
jgi:PAS domain S-box-containing protein